MSNPETYLLVSEPHSGERWIKPLANDAPLDLREQVKAWISEHFEGACELDGELMPRLDGQLYAEIKTDGEPPDSVTCWERGGFYVKEIEA